MHKHGSIKRELKHTPSFDNYSILNIEIDRYKCPYCGYTHTTSIDFKSNEHSITKELETYINILLASHKHTNKEISRLTGVHRHIIRSIDEKRLKNIYYEKDPVTGEEHLKKPETTSRILSIDEFKLHDGYVYATHIIDYETGHVLWIQKGKKKEVV